MRNKYITKSGIPTEHLEQVRLVNWLNQKEILYCAIPNGARTSMAQAKKLKAEGLKAGAPDLLIFTSPKKLGVQLEGAVWKAYHSVAVEMKKQSGGTQSKVQKEWQFNLEECGWIYLLCKGYEDAKKKLTNLGY